MHLSQKYIWALLIALNSVCAWAQINDPSKGQSQTFTVEGSVIDSDTRAPIPHVNIEITGGDYTTTDVFGVFKIQARRGDELTIRHIDFETVFYTIQNNDDIRVEVEPSIQDDLESSKSNKMSRELDSEGYKVFIDSAKYYLRKDAKKSIQFIAEALTKSKSSQENANAYSVLGDVFAYWEQYDLAVSNYRISLQNTNSKVVQFKLAEAYKNNQSYQESLKIYFGINKDDLSNWERITLFEGQGDVYLLTKSYQQAIKSYEAGLNIAKDHLITPKIIDLNSKIAQAYSANGESETADEYFGRSMKLAKTQNKKRAIEEKIKVADFKGEINDISNEIQLRKEALNDLEDMARDSVFKNESSLTPQKQNYKIGRAYASQQDYGSAIPYLQKSIEEADNKKDLLVQKDATRKLSEVYRDAGQFDKALLAYQDYVEVVDQLYIIKEQEIYRAARFSKEIVSKQNRISSLEGDRALSESKYQLTTEQSKRQKLIIYSLISGVLLLLAVALLMYKYIKQQRLANNLLALKSLRSQMNPHFIFNALNSVNSFIASNDERTANKYLTDFSLLMRAVLENSEEDFIPLEKEIELLQLYTKLEHFRFQDKFDYTIQVDENIKIQEFVIPPMLLQPYIENAVWHGLRYKKTKGVLNIDIAQSGDEEIKITIADDGIGRANSKLLKTANQQRQNSKGMGNIKKRVSILNEMYKDKVDVIVTDFEEEADDVGTLVIVTLKKN